MTVSNQSYTGYAIMMMAIIIISESKKKSLILKKILITLFVKEKIIFDYNKFNSNAMFISMQSKLFIVNQLINFFNFPKYLNDKSSL